MSDDKMTTTDGRPVDEVRAEQQAEGNVLHKSYIVLSDEERAKGFVRPYRESYRHIGIRGPRFPLEELTPEDRERYAQFGYAKFERYPPDYKDGTTGRYWTQTQLDSIGKGCGGITTMARSIAETYAREPSFYGATYCAICGTHKPVGENGEFVWADGSGQRVGT